MLNSPSQSMHALDRRTPPSTKPEEPPAPSQPTSLDNVLSQLADQRETMMQHVEAIGVMLAKARGNEPANGEAGRSDNARSVAAAGGVFGELQEVLNSIFHLQDVQRAQIIELSRHV